MESPPSQGVWIEMEWYDADEIEDKSPPSQGVWIEID